MTWIQNFNKHTKLKLTYDPKKQNAFRGGGGTRARTFILTSVSLSQCPDYTPESGFCSGAAVGHVLPPCLSQASDCTFVATCQFHASDLFEQNIGQKYTLQILWIYQYKAIFCLKFSSKVCKIHQTDSCLSKHIACMHVWMTVNRNEPCMNIVNLLKMPKKV